MYKRQSLSHSDLADASTTVASSSTANMDTFATGTYRSAKYFISIVDSANSRFEIVEANVTHDGTNAYIATFGSTTNYTDPLTVFSADIDSGNVNPLILTPPVPFPVSSKGELDALADTVLSAIVIPSIVTEVVVESVVNVPAAGVVPPITAPSIVPPLISISSIITFPVPFADISKFVLLSFVVIVLSFILTPSTSS